MESNKQKRDRLIDSIKLTALGREGLGGGGIEGKKGLSSHKKTQKNFKCILVSEKGHSEKAISI